MVSFVWLTECLAFVDMFIDIYISLMVCINCVNMDVWVCIGIVRCLALAVCFVVCCSTERNNCAVCEV